MINRWLLLFILTFLLTGYSYGQRRLGTVKEREEDRTLQDSLDRRNNRKNEDVTFKKANIEDYLIISPSYDSIYVDTTLTINKFYKLNYLRKDNFNLISFSNIGQSYNTLSYDFNQINTFPKFGARGRHFNYLELEDINYYRVPTPLTELFYKTAFEQGQLLDAFFTINTSERFNFSIAYKGLRSLGNYQGQLTSTGNFRVTANYRSQNNRYKAKAHIVTQDLMNNENGGLRDEDIEKFKSGDEEFDDRSVFDPNFQNAENILVGKRFYLQQEYKLVKEKDSISSSSIDIGNVILFEDKFYRYEQISAATAFFGNAFNNIIYDKVTLEDFSLSGYIKFNIKHLGEITGNINYNNINYGYNKIVNIGDNTIANRIKEDLFTVGGSYKNQLGVFDFKGDFLINFSEQLKGNYIKASASYNFNENNKAEASFIRSSSLPNYNFLLYQSDYVDYNWDNFGIFENQKNTQLRFGLDFKKLLKIQADISNIENYTYFSKNEGEQVKPFQSDKPLRYARIKLNKEIKFGNFALDNTIMYQNVLEGENVLKTPDLITRNTFYYQNHLFKKALYLQTGIKFNYFTEYSMNAYDPLLAEFFVQDQTTLGGFPRLDFFINAKIRQTRLFFIAEHFNASITGHDYFSAPNYPYRDFSIRFGLVWNFFL